MLPCLAIINIYLLPYQQPYILKIKKNNDKEVKIPTYLAWVIVDFNEVTATHRKTFCNPCTAPKVEIIWLRVEMISFKQDKREL